jgi:phage terminase large subunit
MKELEIPLQIPEKLLFFVDRPKRFKIAYGGRLGAKTVSISKILLQKAITEGIKVLGVREYMSSIKHSVHGTLKKQIGVMGLQEYYDVRERDIIGVNGALFDYVGLTRSHGSGVKSYEDFTIAWLEEAETIKEKSLDNLIPTIREEGSEIWISFNPEDEFGAVYSRFVKPYEKEIAANGFYENDQLYVCKINYYDNPFLSQDMFQEAETVKKTNYKKWLWQYGGDVYSDYSDSIIQPEWFEAAIDAHKKLGFKAQGVKSTGFDLADTGDDKALTARHGSVVTKTKRWEFGELPEAIDIAFEFVRETDSEFLVYDDDGLGKSMKVYIAKSMPVKGLEVIPYNGNAKVENPDDYYEDGDEITRKVLNNDKFKNLRAQKYWTLGDRFEATYNALKKHIYTDPDKLISISSECEDLDVLKSELVKIKRVRGNNNLIQIQSKKDAMKEGIKSPNMADSLKMCFANPLPKIFQSVDLEFESEF